MSAQATIRAVPQPRDGAEPSMPISQQGKRKFGILSLLMGETSVKTHTTDGEPAVIRVPHALLGTVVVVILALVSGGYWLVSSLTMLNGKLDSIERNQARIDRNLETQKAYIDAETNQVRFMQGLLTRDQQRTVDEYQRNNPRPKLDQ